MDHRIDIKRQAGLVAWSRDRQKNSYDESEETSRDVPIIARVAE
jgi:hypothetical protein